MEIPVLVKANGCTGDILQRPIMTMDGHLLSAFWNKGACIPDKSIEKEELINELIDEILIFMKLKAEVDHDDLLDALRNHRRGSTASSRYNTTVNAVTKEKQRRSWGPDDTWSRRFVNTFTGKQQSTIVKTNDKNTESPTKEKITKTSKSSGKTTKHSKKTYQHANTESVLSIRNCQPLNRYQDRGNNKNNDDDDGQKSDTRRTFNRRLRQRRKELMKMMSWMCDEGYDYIHTEQATNVSEVEIFVDVMLSSRVPVQMTFKVNSPTDINITYQFLPTFKEEYMILNISKTHCMVMRAF